MTVLPQGHRLSQELGKLLAESQGICCQGDGVRQERLQAWRPVFRFTFPLTKVTVVGKFFSHYPPLTSPDRGLVNEYHAYLQAPAWGLMGEGAYIPRLLGCHPGVRLGLLLEAVSGQDLDHYLAGAGGPEGRHILTEKLAKLADLLAFFHNRPLPPREVSVQPVISYFQKLTGQLQGLGLLSFADEQMLQAEAMAWGELLPRFPDHQVLVHGDATPTNFLFPDGRALALDLERLRAADRLFDLAWVAGEIKHAWGWRFGDFHGSEEVIGHFFRAYFTALPAEADLSQRIYCLNPFYMALAEMRIARNAYLVWDYRRALIDEARRCLWHGRQL